MNSVVALVEQEIDWVAALDARDQAEIRPLLSSGIDALSAAELWVGSKFALASEPPSANGELASTSYAREYVKNIRRQVHELLCGSGGTYASERTALERYGEAGRISVATMIAAEIGPHIGELGRLVLPVVALILVVISKITLKAWCETEAKQKLEDEHSP